MVWRRTGSRKWREYDWKNLIRFFMTPSQKSHYDGTPPNSEWMDRRHNGHLENGENNSFY